MANDSVLPVTVGLQREEEFGVTVHRKPRTIKRWIGMGMPVIKIGSSNWIDPAAARAWFEQGMPGPQPTPRGMRRRRAA
jgi:hypothetical protein